MRKYVIGVIGLIALIIFGIVVTGFYFNRILNMPTGSMSNTIIPGEKILVSGFFSQINRGDIMVFKFPKDPKIKYCMRVIGLSGETIEIRGQKVFINNQELIEKRVQTESSYLDDNSPLREFSTEGTGSYNTYHNRVVATDDSLHHQMKFGVQEPFKILVGEYFVMGDSRDNSVDSRFWGTVKANAMQYKAKKIISSPDPIRDFSDLK